MSARIKWLCRRGMKELDLLVDDYYQHDYPHASEQERAAFARLLEYQDPLIVDLLFERCQDDDPDIQALIDLLKVKNSDGL